MNKLACVLQKLLTLVKGCRLLLRRTQKLRYKTYSPPPFVSIPELRLPGLRKNFLLIKKENYSARGTLGSVPAMPVRPDGTLPMGSRSEQPYPT